MDGTNHSDMQTIPKRPSLVTEVVRILQDGIRESRWVDYLPGERRLASQLNVSRRTLQSALRVIEREGLVRVWQGSRRRIVGRPPHGRPSVCPPVIGLLAAMVGRQRHPTHVMRLTERLRDLAHELGLRLQVHPPRDLLKPNPEDRLESLVRENGARCWVLAAMPRAVQQWFDQRTLPAVVSGSRFDEIGLPAVSRDMRAQCRHAVGVFARHGHRRVAFLMYERKAAGDVLSERGFLEGCAAVGIEPAHALVIDHDGSIPDIKCKVDRLMSLETRPTALLTMDPNYTITITTHLMNSGYRIPGDVSVICRDENEPQHHIVPAITCYDACSEPIITRVCRLVSSIVQTGYAPPRWVRLMPELYMGESVGPPPETR